MRPLALSLGMIFFLIIRYWYISVPLLAVGYMSGHQSDKQERTQFRGCDPKEFSEIEVQQAIRIVVPVHVDDAGGVWPVTFANNAPRSFQSTFYVLCTATETVLDGTTNWVLGVKQYPYLLERQMTIRSASIATEQFRQVSDDMGPFTNLTKCRLYTSDTDASAADGAIETKWVQVTPRGAARAHEIGYTWMGLPLAANLTGDYQNPF